MNSELIEIEKKFRPEIEGLRVVAALLVAVYHIWFNRVSGGVDVFFVISGFLITTSIISTVNKTGEFKFLPYITKLIKRLLPQVLLISTTVMILSYFLLPLSIVNKTIKEVIASILYYQNWQLALSSTDYLDASQMKTPMEHFWALSIQGQFYILWFLLFSFIIYLIKKFSIINTRKLLNSFLLLIFFISLAFSIYLTEVNQPLAYFITFTRVWEFALGGLICVNLQYIHISKLAATVLGWIGLIGLLLTGVMFNVSENFPGYIALWPMICAFFIIVSGSKPTNFGVNNLLALPFMIKLGGVSFAIYLWHWVIFSFYKYNYSNQNPNLWVGLAIILLSILLAFASTKYIEKPIRNATNNKYAFKRLGQLAIINIGAIAILFISVNIDEPIKNNNLYVGAMALENEDSLEKVDPIPPFSKAFDDLPESHLDGSNQTLNNSSLKIGEYGELDSYDKTIVLIGSSHSEHWLGALLEANKNTNHRILTLTRSGTRFSTGYKDTDLKGEWNNNVLSYLETADVDLIISHATAADTSNKKTQQQMIDQLSFVHDKFGIEVLAIRDNPRYSFNVLESVETNGVEKTINLMNAEDSQKDDEFWNEFILKNKKLNTIDFSQYFKVDDLYQPIIGNVVVYRDNKHMTNSFSETFGPILEEKINHILD